MSSNYVTVSGGQGEYRSIPFRYVWPAELDLMAQLAGLRLRERWGGWRPRAFHRRQPPARLHLGEALTAHGRYDRIGTTAFAVAMNGKTRSERHLTQVRKEMPGRRAESRRFL